MSSASIIVINWNGGTYLEACLESLLTEVTAKDEIIVVDNNSTDDSVGLLRSQFPDVKLLPNERNLGFAGGANVGLRAAHSEVLVLLNPDVVVCAGWLNALKSALEDGRVGVVGCKLYYPGDKIIQHAGGIIDLPLATANHHGYRQRDEGQWDRERDVDYVTGASFALRRDMLGKVGFFDKEFFPGYFEEVDYCYRVRKAGHRVIYVPGAVAIHHEYASLEEGGSTYLRYFHRNRLRFVLKHFELQRVLEEFVPAERDWLKKNAPPRVRHVFGSVYLEAMLAYPKLCLNGRVELDGDGEDAVSAVLAALAGLRDQVWGHRVSGGLDD